jgi:predicted RecA/RadA family phage recombinase
MVGQCYFSQEDLETVKYTYGSAATSWTPIHVAGIGVLIPQASFSAGVEGGYFKCGAFSFPITSGVTLAVGNVAYLDSAAGTIQAAKPTAGFLVGRVLSGGTGDSGGTVFAKVEINEYEIADSSSISLLGSNGILKGTFATINLAVAAAVAGDVVRVGPGEFTLTAGCDITKSGVKIVGAGKSVTTIVAAVGADYGFKTVLGALAASGDVTFSGFTLDHTDDSAQVGIQVSNLAATKKISVYVNDMNFETDGGNSIDIDHPDTANAVRVYVDNSTTEGPVNMVTADAGDRLRFNYCTVRGGVVTDTGNFDLEMLFRHCIVKHGGISGGHSNQRCIYVNCVSETDADPNVYATVDADDNVGSATDQIIA